VNAQIDFNNYQILQSSGIVPNDFLHNFEDRYHSQRNNLTQKQRSLLGEKAEYFLLYSSYRIESLFKSGLVTFNDPVAEYASDILDIILDNEQSLRKKIRVYTLKSNAVNAFITNDGIIFITLGLIAQLESEAQLAFVLAHEIIHYKKNHHIKEFLKRQDLIEEKTRHESEEDLLRTFLDYSRDFELEADAEAFKNYYMSSGYANTEIESFLDILLYSYLPIDEIKFHLNFFESDTYKFPETYTVSQYNEITAIEDYDDTESTHPNILKRRSALISLLAGYKDKGTTKFKISEERFRKLRKTARYELSYLYRIFNDPEKGIYNSYILSQDDPNNKYLKTNIAEQLYALAYYKNRGKYNKVHTNYKKIEGYSQQVNYLFTKLKKDELNLLALRYAWQLKTDYPDDAYIAQLTDSTIKENARYLKLNLSELPTEIVEKLDSADYAKLNKTEKIKYNKKIAPQEADKYHYKALIGLKDPHKIIRKYNDFVNEISARSNEQSEQKASMSVNKIVMLTPHLEIKNKFLSEKGIEKFAHTRADFTESFLKSATKLKIQIEQQNLKNITKNDINKYNEHALTSLWVYEMTTGISGVITGTEKYVKERYQNSEKQYFINTGITENNNTPVYFLILYDLKNGSVVYTYSNYLKRLSKDYIRSNIYNSLYRINN
jgi:hypothetical protein